MNVVNVKSKADLEGESSKLISSVSNLESEVTSMKTALESVTNYDGIMLGDAARRVSINLTYTYGDIRDVSESISNYTQNVTKFDKNDFSSSITLSQPSMSVVGFTQKVTSGNAISPIVAKYTSTGSGTVYNIPAGLGSVHTYMGWQCITSPSSNQYKLREAAGMNFDSEGFGIINGRYVVATTTTYGNVGDYIDVVQADGTVIPCIIGDIKNPNDEGCNKWGHLNGQNVVEFVVDKDSWYGSKMHCNPGTASCHPEWSQAKTQIINRGNYFDSPNGPSDEVSAVNLTASTSDATTTSSQPVTNNAPTVASSNTKTTPVSSANTTVSVSTDTSNYHNNEANGFVVSSGNQTYNLSDSDYDLLCSIVSAESDKSYDDALAVVSTILNRCETPAWINSHGTNPISQATAPNQFVVYQEGHYLSYTNGNSPDTVKTAVSDALNGLRNHDYLSFRSNGSTGYSDNMITPTGNRYK